MFSLFCCVKGIQFTLMRFDERLENGGVDGEVAQFGVIRCTAGGGGGGPVLSGCTRVGRGPVEMIAGDGLFTASLAGSTQDDAAPADARGIVVQVGDIVCADSANFDIGVDCSGTSAPGGS